MKYDYTQRLRGAVYHYLDRDTKLWKERNGVLDIFDRYTCESEIGKPEKAKLPEKLFDNCDVKGKYNIHMARNDIVAILKKVNAILDYLKTQEGK